MKLRVQDITNLPPDTLLRAGFLYSFPFSIEIPEIQSSTACRDIEDHGHTVGDYHLRVPPTLAHPPEYPVPASDMPNNAARITYKLTAVLKRFSPKTGEPVAYASTHIYINISPSYAVAPEDLVPPAIPFKSFVEVTKRSGKLSSSKKPLGVAQLTFDHFPILPLSTKTVTMLPLSIKFYPSKSAPNTPPPPIRRLSVYLKARTVYSNETSFKTLPTNFGAVRNLQIESRFSDVIDPAKGLSLNASKDSTNSHLPPGFKEVFQTYIVTQMNTSCGFQWPQTPVPVSHNSSRQVYDASFAIPMVMPTSHQHALIPSYRSCFTMRDYTVVICAEFSSSCILNIEVPAVLVKNQSDALSNASIPGYSLLPEVPIPSLEKPIDRSSFSSSSSPTSNSSSSSSSSFSALSSPSSPSSPLSVQTSSHQHSHQHHNTPSPASSSTNTPTPRSPRDLSPHSAYSSSQDDLLVIDAFERKVPKSTIPSLLASRR